MRAPLEIDHWPDKNAFSVYGLKDPRHGKFCYVGQARDVRRRFQQHMDGSYLHSNAAKERWIEELRSQKMAPNLEVLEQFESCTQADAGEKEWIRRLIEQDHPLLNIADGGAGNRGAKKFNKVRKQEWIDLGYIVKAAREATMYSMCELSHVLPKNSKEGRLFKKALAAIEEAQEMLDGRLCNYYPSWEDVTRVFYSTRENHFAQLAKTPADEAE